MKKTDNYCRTGFTLMEILIVMAILALLFAFLLPRIFQQLRKQDGSKAELEIQTLMGDIELYKTQNRGYPTNEQGLYALVYFPDSQGVSAASQPGSTMPGASAYDLTGGQSGMTQGLGTDMPYNSTASIPGTMPMTGTTGQIDPMALPGYGMQGAAGTAGYPAGYSVWTLPTSNPQLYTQRRKRPDGIDEKRMTDPWGLPYRYDFTPTNYGVNQFSWESRPAIWSAGPDGKDHTDDDIRSWNPADVPARQAEVIRQFQLQQQTSAAGGMSQGVGTAPMTPGANPMMPPMNPMTPGANPMMPPMNPMTPGANPMMPPMNPMSPGGNPMMPATNPMTPGANPMQPPMNPMTPGGNPMMPATNPMAPMPGQF